MKAKIILYGWGISWLFLFAGIGTMENGGELAGALLSTVWFGFSLALIKNEEACGNELERFEEWMVRLLGGSHKDNNQGLGFN
nr:MAG TPA: Positive regulator of sigma(E), RseC/MucC [Caudoviricetes sp.]